MTYEVLQFFSISQESNPCDTSICQGYSALVLKHFPNSQINNISNLHLND